MSSSGDGSSASLMRRLHGAFVTARRRWRAVLCLLAGGLAATGFPPLHLVVFVVPAFVLLFWAVDACRRWRSALAAGWLFGVGHFAVGFYWVGHAFLVDSERYGWMAPFAVAGMACGLALFPALAALLAKTVFQNYRLAVAARVLVFATTWSALEWLRGWILTGLPWNQIGSVWAYSETMMQAVSVIGILGLGWLTVFAATLPAVFAHHPGQAKERLWPLAGFGLLAVMAGFGLWRLQTATPAQVPGVLLRLVQPNVPQHLKWQPSLRMGHVRRLAALSLRPPLRPGRNPTHLIWPETAVPFDLPQDANLLRGLGEITPAGGLLLTGAPRSNGPDQQAPQYWNSLIAVDPAGDIAGIYDKVHLVPFGEYVPWREVLDITKLTTGRGDFSSGQTARTLALAGLPAVAPLICYEIIFASEVRAIGPSPKWLLNITNDAWFGHSAGPFQHLALARIRAAEMGLPVVRVANTGITALIDPYGRVVEQLALGTEGILDVELPEPVTTPTLYARFGDLLVLLLVAACAMIVFPFRK